MEQNGGSCAGEGGPRTAGALGEAPLSLSGPSGDSEDGLRAGCGLARPALGGRR